MNFKMDKYKRRGIIGTVLFHVVVLVLMLLLGLRPPEPPRPSIGMEINLGNSEDGMGEIQPEQPQEVKSTPPPTPQPKNVQQEEVVEGVDETINLENSKKVEPTPQPDPEPVEEEKPSIDQKYLFNKKSTSESGSSEGNTDKPGDRGKETGSKTSNSYTGSGGQGGIAYSVAGRKSLSLPKPDYSSSEQGTVVVKIWVDRTGKVTNARVQITGTTTSSSELQDLAIKAALKATFNVDPDAMEVQTGTITYQFVL